MSADDLVLVLGDINLDAILRVAEYPPLGEDSIVESAVIGPGGGAANAACVLAKLGLYPRLLARAGSDPFGDLAVHEVQAAGVDVSAVERDSQRQTGMIVVPVVPGGERTMFSSRGANPAFSLTSLTHDMLQGVKAVQLTGYAFLASPQRDAAWRVAELAHEMGIPLALDLNLEAARRYPAEMRRLARMLDICTLGSADGEALYGTYQPESIAHSQLELGTRLVAVKLGARGAYLAEAGAGAPVTIPAFRVASVDATGAGDAFSAGLLFARLHRLDLQAGGILAGIMGALATTVWGGGPALPGKVEAVGYLDEMMGMEAYAELVPAMQRAQAALRYPGPDAE
jgi:sugar/nucleoside kinase (ribokinase family)